ncbi:MAG: hypothetical protein RL365_833 [Bacteroidota bacterium]|jgi:hypothetical protein
MFLDISKLVNAIYPLNFVIPLRLILDFRSINLIETNSFINTRCGSDGVIYYMENYVFFVLVLSLI